MKTKHPIHKEDLDSVSLDIVELLTKRFGIEFDDVREEDRFFDAIDLILELQFGYPTYRNYN
jgi:hypothetical protein